MQEAVQFDAEHVTSLDGATYLIVRHPDVLDVEVTVLDRPVGEQQVTPKSRGAAPQYWENHRASQAYDRCRFPPRLFGSTPPHERIS